MPLFGLASPGKRLAASGFVARSSAASLEAVSKRWKPRAPSKPPAAGMGPTTIPVQADWLESDDDRGKPGRASGAPQGAARTPRPSPRPRPQKGPPPLPPLPPEHFEDPQRALQRLQALHPARDNAWLIDELQHKLKTEIDDGAVKVTTRQGHVVLKLTVDGLFAPGKDSPKAAGAVALTEIAAVLSGMAVERFQVEGCAPAAKAAEWRLRASQAMEVAKRLAASGIAAKRISVAAFGELGVETPAEREGLAITILRGEVLVV